jgi:hypothetical protein
MRQIEKVVPARMRRHGRPSAIEPKRLLHMKEPVVPEGPPTINSDIEFQPKTSTANLWICLIASFSRPSSSLWIVRFGPIRTINPSI